MLTPMQVEIWTGIHRTTESKSCTCRPMLLMTETSKEYCVMGYYAQLHDIWKGELEFDESMLF